MGPVRLWFGKYLGGFAPYMAFGLQLECVNYVIHRGKDERGIIPLIGCWVALHLTRLLLELLKAGSRPPGIKLLKLKENRIPKSSEDFTVTKSKKMTDWLVAGGLKLAQWFFLIDVIVRCNALDHIMKLGPLPKVPVSPSVPQPEEDYRLCCECWTHYPIIYTLIYFGYPFQHWAPMIVFFAGFMCTAESRFGGFGAITLQLIVLLPKWILMLITHYFSKDTALRVNEVRISLMLMLLVHTLLHVWSNWGISWVSTWRNKELPPGSLADRLKKLCKSVGISNPKILVGSDSKCDKLVALRRGNILVLEEYLLGGREMEENGGGGTEEAVTLTEEEIEGIVAQELWNWKVPKRDLLDKLEGYLVYTLPVAAFAILLVKTKLWGTSTAASVLIVVLMLVLVEGSEWVLKFLGKRSELEADRIAVHMGYGQGLELALKKILAVGDCEDPYYSVLKERVEALENLEEELEAELKRLEEKKKGMQEYDVIIKGVKDAGQE